VSEPHHDYLWDQSGVPDPGIEHLEELLSGFRLRAAEPAWNHGPARSQPPRGTARQMLAAKHRWLPACLAFAVLAAIAIGISVRLRFEWRPGEPWQIDVLHGSPELSGAPIARRADLVVGQVLTTGKDARARIHVAGLGVVDAGPDSRIRLIATSAKHHRIALDYGTISAHMWAPPFSLAVDTPSAKLFDLGCAFTLHVDQNGRGMVSVTSGWVEFATASRSVIIPAGAEAVTEPGVGPGTPYFSDGPPAFKTAVNQLDSHSGDDPEKAAALQSILENARARDALTLLSLIRQLPRAQREMVLDRLAVFVPIPSGYTRDDVLDLRKDAMDAYWNALRLGSPKSWIMHWQDVLTY
jgi:hypothetical protein